MFTLDLPVGINNLYKVINNITIPFIKQTA